MKLLNCFCLPGSTSRGTSTTSPKWYRPNLLPPTQKVRSMKVTNLLAKYVQKLFQVEDLGGAFQEEDRP